MLSCGSHSVSLWTPLALVAGLVSHSIAAENAECKWIHESSRVFRAGAAIVDISPSDFPAVVSGGFLERTANRLNDPLHCRCLVLDDGTTRIAIVVVDNLLMPRNLLDGAKREAHDATGILTDRIMISATHTHSAPSVVGALGTGIDEAYTAKLGPWIVESIRVANSRLEIAEVGWGVVEDTEHTNCRRWIRRPDRIGHDPFGHATIRAMMHPGYQHPDYEGPAGPVDPALTVLSVRAASGRPIALLANYSMHYFGAAPVSADYYGRFCQIVKEQIRPSDDPHPFVAIMSQGTSGDLHWMDYSQPAKSISIEDYSKGVAESALKVYQKIDYQDWVPLAMEQEAITLRRRAPDETRLEWAREIISKMDGQVPRSQQEVYAREQICLHEEPVRELFLQAIRIGELGMVAMPCEVFGLTGLKIKAQSPLGTTLNFELANGAEGYIPPPEQHFLGGYTTWPARSAGLEVTAEPKIVESVLSLLETVAGKPRRKLTNPSDEYSQTVLASNPIAYWRLSEMAGDAARDSSKNQNHGVYEPGVAFFLPGPESAAFGDDTHKNRAVHFVGGRLAAVLEQLDDQYSVELWFWNALPADARAVTGYLFSRGQAGELGAPGFHLGIGGSHQQSLAQGRLFVYNGDAEGDLVTGTANIGLREWDQVVLVRDRQQVAVYLNGKSQPDVIGQMKSGHSPSIQQVFVGGRSDSLFNFEGKIDEVSVYDRVLAPNEIVSHFKAAKM